MKRISSIDIARGFVMIIMALDHTRDFLHAWSATHSPTDLAVTTPLLFFTRWITHFCAPAFVFLAGTSAAIQLQRSTNPAATRRWLLRRGLILIVIEFTLVNFGLSFDPKFRLLLFEVIATIGAGMILLSLLSRLPFAWLLVITILLFAGHELLPVPQAMGVGAPDSSSALRIIRTFGWTLGTLQPTPNLLILVAYPILPWLGIMLTGFLAARWFQNPQTNRRRLFIITGLTGLGLFLVLRLLNGYGDSDPWSSQKTPILTLISFLNVTKYPPSLMFGLLTLGALFLILAAAERRDNRVTRILLVYGRVPLFYFIVHIYIIHFILLIVVFAQGYSLNRLNFANLAFARPPAGSGLPTWSIYPIWFAVVAALYPVCRWYGHYKAAHPEKSLLRYF
jgi:uncharacterized membrane protein